MIITLLQAAMAAGLTVLPIIVIVLLAGIFIFTFIIYSLFSGNPDPVDTTTDRDITTIEEKPGSSTGLFLLSLVIAMGISFVLVLLGTLLLSGFIPDIE